MFFNTHLRSLQLVSDNANWSIHEDMVQLHQISKWLGYKSNLCSPESLKEGSRFYGCQFGGLVKGKWSSQSRVGVSYFHGLPNTGCSEFDQCYEALCRRKDEIHRIQVTHSEMEKVVLSSGIDPQKVHLIRIGISSDDFQRASEISRLKKRQELDIPEDAWVIGSFQKDGNGWGEGLEPKKVKGPDLFVEALELVKQEVSNVWALLTGPSRGYVKKELEKRGIPYRHVYLEKQEDIPKMYHALDACLVSSRQEGGPKAVLESMASGIPIVSTRVGQATELIRNGENGFLCDIENVKQMAEKIVELYRDPQKKVKLIEAGFSTAEENTYRSQLPQWEKFLEGFVLKPLWRL